METLSKVAGLPLYWVQPDTFARWFELRAGENLVATLGWQTSCGTLAMAESGDGRWTFKRLGFLNPRVAVREAGSEIDIATFWPSCRDFGRYITRLWRTIAIGIVFEAKTIPCRLWHETTIGLRRPFGFGQQTT